MPEVQSPHSSEEWDYWDEEIPDLPEHTNELFFAAYDELVGFAADHGKAGTNKLETRMLFMTAFGAFEAYLSDTYARLALMSPDNQRDFLKDRVNSKNISFEINGLVNRSEDSVASLLENRIRAEIRTYSFHKLTEVMRLYRLFKIDIFKDLSDEKETLMKVVSLRHHCAHRNGRDENGKELSELTVPLVLSVLEAMRAVVISIENQFFEVATEDLENDLPI